MGILAIILLAIGGVGMGLARKYEWNHFSHFIWKSTLAVIFALIGTVLAFVAYGWYGFIPVVVSMLISSGIAGSKR